MRRAAYFFFLFFCFLGFFFVFFYRCTVQIPSLDRCPINCSSLGCAVWIRGGLSLPWWQEAGGTLGLVYVVALARVDTVGALCGLAPVGVCQDHELPLAPSPALLWDRPVPPCCQLVAQQPRPRPLVLLGLQKALAGPLVAMRPAGHPAALGESGCLAGFSSGLVPEPYDSFMVGHLRYYGYFQGEPWPRGHVPLSPGHWSCSGALPKARRRAGRRALCPWGTPLSNTPPRHLAPPAPAPAACGVLGRSAAVSEIPLTPAAPRHGSVLPPGLELRPPGMESTAGGLSLPWGGGVVLGVSPPQPFKPELPAPCQSHAVQPRAHQSPPAPPGPLAASGALEPAPCQGTPVPSAQRRGSLGEPRALFALPSARGPLPAPRWPVECEVIKETIKHIGEGALTSPPPQALC